MPVDALERRSHLSVAATSPVGDFGGLPRNLTAVGDYVYATIDPKADGVSTVSDLVGLNVKTGQRTVIRRADGSHFERAVGLAREGKRLVIVEPRADKPRFYRVTPGAKTAIPFDRYAVPKGVPAEHRLTFHDNAQA